MFGVQGIGPFRTIIGWMMLALAGFGCTALATIVSEDIGELKIHDLLLRPNFMLEEPSEGGFSIGESSFALRWELEQKFIGVVRIGPRTLLNPSVHYTPTVNDDIVMVEAFAEYTDTYGRFRLGRLPVAFGYEGRLWERELIFPRSLLFQKRITSLRDEGVSYDISENNWYTGFVIHNGDSVDDFNGRLWYTARWGYKGDRFEIGAAGQSGSTNPQATASSGDTLAGVNTALNEKWRLGGVYANVSQRTWEWVFEGYLGALEQQKTSHNFFTGHTDLSYLFSKSFSTHLRYDYFNDPHYMPATDSNLTSPGEAETQVSVALMFSNTTHSSNIIVVGTKDLVQGGDQTSHDSIRVIWSLSPAGVVRF